MSAERRVPGTKIAQAVELDLLPMGHAGPALVAGQVAPSFPGLSCSVVAARQPISRPLQLEQFSEQIRDLIILGIVTRNVLETGDGLVQHYQRVRVISQVQVR